MKVHPGMLKKTQEGGHPVPEGQARNWGRAQEDFLDLHAGRRATNLVLTHDVVENKDS